MKFKYDAQQSGLVPAMEGEVAADYHTYVSWFNALRGTWLRGKKSDIKIQNISSSFIF